jgi:hypothetical protein
VQWFANNWFRSNWFANNWFAGQPVSTEQPSGGFEHLARNPWFWRAIKRRKDEDLPSDEPATVSELLPAKPAVRVDPARAAADVAAALAAAREFVARAYVEPGVDLSAVAARYQSVALPFPLPEDTSDEDAIALILLLSDV